MKFRITALTCLITFCASGNAKVQSTEILSGKAARLEARESAHQARLAATMAIAASDEAIKISLREEVSSFRQDLRRAAINVNTAARQMEEKAEVAYRKSLASNKELALRALTEAKHAVLETEIALQRADTSTIKEMNTDKAAIRKTVQEIKPFFERSLASSKIAAKAAEESVAAAMITGTNEVDAVAERTVNYSQETKIRIQRDFKNEVKAADLEMKKFNLVLKSKSSDAKKELNLSLSELKAKRNEVSAKIVRLSKANSAAWSDMKVGVEAAVEDMKVSFKKTSDDFKRE